MAAAAPIAAAAAVASAVVGAVSAVQQGKAAKAAANYNATLQEQQADLSRQTAAVEEQRQRLRAQRVMSAARASMGAAGVDLEGSPLMLMEESAADAEFDALAIRHAGETQAWRARAQAGLDRFEGKVASRRGYMAAGASILNGISSAASIYAPKTAPAGGTQPAGYVPLNGGAYG